jgi:hypothetical protein
MSELKNDILDNESDNKNEDSMSDNFKKLKATVEALEFDFSKFYDKRVKVAGSRCRNNLMNCKKLCDTLRKQILEDIKDLPTKHRIEESEAPPMLELKREETLSNLELTEPLKTNPIELLDEVKIKKQRKPRRANKVKTETV